MIDALLLTIWISVGVLGVIVVLIIATILFVLYIHKNEISIETVPTIVGVLFLITSKISFFFLRRLFEDSIVFQEQIIEQETKLQDEILQDINYINRYTEKLSNVIKRASKENKKYLLNVLKKKMRNKMYLEKEFVKTQNTIVNAKKRVKTLQV